MSKMIKAAVLAACVLSAGAAHAQLGGLGNMMGGNKSASSGTDVSADVTAFVTQSNTLRELASTSVVAINLAFMNAEEYAKARAEFDSANKISDPKEKSVKQAQLLESHVAALSRRKDSGELETQMKGLDSKKKKMVGNALMNFAIGGLQAAELTKTGQSIIQKAGSNPMNLSKIVPVKDALPLLGQVAKDSTGLIAGLIKLAKGANIDVPAVKLQSKTAPVEV